MSKTSLKNKLYNHIKKNGSATLDELFDIMVGYKQSNGERTLRGLAEEGKIKTIYNEKKYVKGYEMPTSDHEFWSKI